MWLTPGSHTQWDQELSSCLTSEEASVLFPEAPCGKLPVPSPGLPESLHETGTHNPQNMSMPRIGYVVDAT